MSSTQRAVRRVDRLLDDAGAREYLTKALVCYIGTVSEDGWPYVLPMTHIYEGGDILWFHQGAKPGHLLENLTRDSRVCLTVGEKWDLVPGPQFACQSRQQYESVVVFGRVERVEDETRKNWFFDEMVKKYGGGHVFPDPSYPLIHKIVLWKMTIERLTGKLSVEGGGH